LNIADDKLIKGSLRGDEKMQRALYEKYKVQMFRICLRYAIDRSEAEDILQDGFIKIYTDLHQYSFKGPLGGWMRRVMVNAALQHIRKNKRRLQTAEIKEAIHKYTQDHTVYDNLNAQELTNMIQKLPEGYRVVFNLYVVEGYSHKEIAQMLKISESTSKTQLFKAKKALRKMLEFFIET